MKYTFTLITTILIAFISNAQNHHINQIFNWDDPAIVGSTWFNNAYNEVWGVTINGSEFAIIGSTDGTHIFDVTDENNIAEVDFLSNNFTGGGVIHRDYHDYNGYLYVVCDEGGVSTLQIFDITSWPSPATEVYNSNSLFTRSHNIFIDTATAKLYVCSHSSSSGFDPMVVYSLADPANPTHMVTYTDPGHVHDVYVRNDTAYCNNGNDGFAIVKFNDSNYEVLGTLTSYPESGYNHSGWLSDDGQYYVMCDETWGTRMKLLDVSDPTDIQVVSLFGPQTNAASIVHNVIIEDNYVFASHYFEGLQIYDISDPVYPVNVGSFDTHPQDPINGMYEGAWGVYPTFESEKIIVGDMQSGLFVFDVSLQPVADFTYQVVDGEIILEDNSNWNPVNFYWSVDGNSAGFQSTANSGPLANGIYTVCLEVGNQQGTSQTCQDVQVLNVVSTLNFESFDAINIVLQENDMLNINYFLGESANVNYSIFSLDGKMMYNTVATENKGNVVKTFSLKSLKSSGIFIVTLQTENAKFSQKIFVE